MSVLIAKGLDIYTVKKILVYMKGTSMEGSIVMERELMNMGLIERHGLYDNRKNCFKIMEHSIVHNDYPLFRAVLAEIGRDRGMKNLEKLNIYQAMLILSVECDRLRMTRWLATKGICKISTALGIALKLNRREIVEWMVGCKLADRDRLLSGCIKYKRNSLLYRLCKRELREKDIVSLSIEYDNEEVMLKYIGNNEDWKSHLTEGLNKSKCLRELVKIAPLDDVMSVAIEERRSDMIEMRFD